MDKVKTFTRKIDAFQRSHTALAFPVAVVKRYGDEEAGKQAALVTYYAFLSVFPLLLIFITVLGIVVSSNPELEARITENVFHLFPALSRDLQDNVHTLKSSGPALALQALVLLYGARGLASILQDTFNNLWHIAKEHRPGILGDYARSFGMMIAVGLGMILGSVLSFVLTSVIHLGIIGVIFINLVNVAVTFGLILLVFRLGTSNKISLKKLILGAGIATIGLIIVQILGGYIMSEHLPKLEGSYGSFAITLGLLFWIYLQAQVLLYAIVTTVVRTEKDWPKKLF
ncbi:MAG: ribonuclease [Candidatus Saccharibacteria bacterium]|nr:ribonuclease [Candidatus Saccharibacteria bacterium]